MSTGSIRYGGGAGGAFAFDLVATKKDIKYNIKYTI